MAKSPSPIRLGPEEYDALRRWILSRDGYKCRVPGCKARQNLHVHHIVFRSQQGSDTKENLITVCDTCHNAIHGIPVYGIVILPTVGVQTEVNANHGVRWKFQFGWRPSNRAA